MVYRHDTQLLEKYQAARETLLEGPIFFSPSPDKEEIQGRLDKLRTSLHGWKKPTPEDQKGIASLEEELAMVYRSESIDSVLCGIGFSYKCLNGGKMGVPCYTKEIGDNIGILMDRNFVSGENAPCFYQIRSADLASFREWVYGCDLSEPESELGLEVFAGGVIGGFFGFMFGLGGTAMYAVVTGAWEPSPLGLGIAVGISSIAVALRSGMEERKKYLEKKAKIASYPKERRDYFVSIQLASGIDALTLATTPPYGVEERVQMRVGDVEDDEVELGAESEESKEQRRTAAVMPFKIPE